MLGELGNDPTSYALLIGASIGGIALVCFLLWAAGKALVRFGYTENQAAWIVGTFILCTPIVPFILMVVWGDARSRQQARPARSLDLTHLQ